MPLYVVDVCDDDGVSGESLIGKAGASRLFLFLLFDLIWFLTAHQMPVCSAL